MTWRRFSVLLWHLGPNSLFVLMNHPDVRANQVIKDPKEMENVLRSW